MSVEINKSDWQETTLGEVANITMGQSPKGETYNLVGDGLPFYQGVTEFGDRYVQIRMYTSAPSKVVDPGTILFSVRAPVGRINFTKHRACIGRGNAGLTMKNGNQDFLFYLLKYSERQIQNRASGTVFTSISGKELKEIPIIIPKNKQDQRSIASVLSSLDNKIELLREQNKTLEAIAQNLFNEWFVEYNFPNGVGKPYKKSGGKMVDGELGEMPEGWRVDELNSIVNLRGGTTPSTKNPEYWGGNIAWTSPKDLSGNREMFLRKTANKISELGLARVGSGLLPVGTVLLSSRAPIGYLAISSIPVAINQGYIALLPQEHYSSYFMYLWIKYNLGKIISAANGSTFLEISKSALKKISFIRPPEELVVRFSKIISPFFEKIYANESHQVALCDSREILLPRMMSGEVHVKGVKLN